MAFCNKVYHHVNIKTNLTFVSSGSDNCAIHHAGVTYTYRKIIVVISHQSVVKCREKHQLISIHANIKDPNQACEMSTTVLITMLISTSLLCLSPTNASSAAYRVKEQSVLGTNTPFINKVYVC